MKWPLLFGQTRKYYPHVQGSLHFLFLIVVAVMFCLLVFLFLFYFLILTASVNEFYASAVKNASLLPGESISITIKYMDTAPLFFFFFWNSSIKELQNMAEIHRIWLDLKILRFFSNLGVSVIIGTHFLRLLVHQSFASSLSVLLCDPAVTHRKKWK